MPDSSLHHLLGQLAGHLQDDVGCVLAEVVPLPVLAFGAVVRHRPHLKSDGRHELGRRDGFKEFRVPSGHTSPLTGLG